MEWLIWLGAVTSLGGVAVIVWCAVAVMRARRAGLDDAAMRNRLQRLVIYNMAALGVSVLGLMLVVMGVMLA